MLHWRGDAWQAGQTAVAVLQTALGALRACAATAPRNSPSITTDQPGRVAAVVSTPGRQVLREYLLVDPRSGTLVNLAMWTSLPQAVEWRRGAGPRGLRRDGRPAVHGLHRLVPVRGPRVCRR